MKGTIFSVVVLEILKVHLLSSYFLLALGQPASAIPASFAFVAAFMLGRILGRRGGRVVLYWFIMVAGCAVSFLAFPKGSDWLSALVVGVSASVYWFRGAWLAKQFPDHQFCLARFDEGIWMAIIVYSFAALFGIPNTLGEMLVYPLGYFSILILGLSKTASKTGDGFFTRQSSPVASSYALVFIAAIVGLSLLVPLLVGPVLWTSGKLASTAFGFIQYLASIMDRFFALDPELNQPSGPALFSAPPSAIGDPEPGVHTYIFLFILLVMAILSVAFLTVTGLVKLFRYFGSSTEKKQESGSVRGWLTSARQLWTRIWMRLKLLFVHQHPRPGQACLLYLRYQALGRMVGCARRPQETARHYSRRLGQTFPVSARQADFVIEAFEKEFFGGKTLDTVTENELKAISKQTGILSFFAERTSQAVRHVFPGRGGLRA